MPERRARRNHDLSPSPPGEGRGGGGWEASFPPPIPLPVGGPTPGGRGSKRGGKEGKGEAAKAEGCFAKVIIPKARPRVLVVGSANLDLVVRVPRLPFPGETVLGEAKREYFGGKGANQAVAAARAGGRVRFVCMLGEDDAGRRYRARLRAEGVEGAGLLTAPGTATGCALIVVDGEGRNQIAVAPGANARLSPRRVPGGLLDFGEVVLAQLEVPLATVALALRRARARGAATILNPAPARPLPQGLLRRVDVLVPNESEASMLLGGEVGSRGEARAACRELQALGPQGVVLTMGGEGVCYRWGGEEGHIPAPRVRVRDTTGAGDAFCGALAVALAEGRDFLSSLRFAMAAAALSVTRVGAQEGLPGRGAVESFLRRWAKSPESG